MPTPHSSFARRRWWSGSVTIALLYLLLIGLYLGWQSRPANLGVFAHEYDEGVYLQTALALRAGHDLYGEIFSSQPPLVPYLLEGIIVLVGPSVAAARELIILLSLLGLGGVGLLATRLRGWTAGLGAVGLLALSPIYFEVSHTISPEAPALALAVLALSIVISAPLTRPRWWLLGGLVFALAGLAKLSALIILPALVVVASWGAWRSGRHLALAARALALFALPSLLLWGIMLMTVDRGDAFNQLITFRTSAQDVYGLSVRGNARMIFNLMRYELVTWLLVPIGLLSLIAHRQWRALAITLTLLLTPLVALLTYTPLFDHHLVLLLPAPVVLGGIAIQAALAALRQWSRQRWSLLRRPTLLLPIASLVVAGAFVPTALQTSISRTPDALTSWQEAQPAVALLRSLQGDDIEVLTDDQMLAFAAGRSVPPALVDTSRVRISAGYLDLDEITESIEANPPEAVLLWSGRLRRVPGFLEWVKDHYDLHQSFGSGRALYLRR